MEDMILKNPSYQPYLLSSEGNIIGKLQTFPYGDPDPASSERWEPGLPINNLFSKRGFRGRQRERHGRHTPGIQHQGRLSPAAVERDVGYQC